ncbi:MAG: zinc-binding alcohol dehydrogenase [Actinomycetota bacterium]|nr:zinc-binding alcohol dehydrogenase [Actinomycetota bacterium]
MPRELIALEPRKPVLREYEEPELRLRQIRIRTEFASPKHGTELVGYRNESAVNRPYDPEWGCMIPRPEGEVPRNFPLGNMAVGVVTEVGPEVTRFRVGERVFGHFPIRETHTVDETAADPLPEGLDPEEAVCLDPAVMALAVRDAQIRLGDHVAVFGLGAIGLMAVQMARIAGAEKVIAVDPIEPRRSVAVALGADVALDPLADGGDAGMAIRRISGFAPSAVEPPTRVTGGYWEIPTQFGQRGVDVAVEAAGSAQALHHAIRATRFGGTVCVMSFYGKDAAGLRLGEEFHVNRLQMVSARVESLPLRDAPVWTLERLVEVALGWLTSGRLRTEGIVTPVVPFDESVEAYREIDEHPERSIKLGISFP